MILEWQLIQLSECEEKSAFSKIASLFNQSSDFRIERFSNDCRKPKPKQLLRPITTGAGSAMNQSQFLAITCNSLEAREKSRVRGAIAFGFDFHWLKTWRDSFKPITKRGNRNHVITFDSHLKTTLY